MFVADCLRVNQEGHLCIEEQDTLELAAKYGTPLYVMSETQIRKNCQRYRDSLKRFYDGNGLALYASKAFCCKEICRIAAEEGMGLDVVSGGELYTAISAGVSPEKIYFHGNNKTAPELVAALEHKVGTIVVDNLEELEMLDRLAGTKNMRQEIMLRVKPGVDAHTHNFIRTGQIDSKFGFALETGEAMAAVKEAVGRSNVVLTGLHCHIGSQIFDTEPFLLTARIMIGSRQDVSCKSSIWAAVLVSSIRQNRIRLPMRLIWSGFLPSSTKSAGSWNFRRRIFSWNRAGRLSARPGLPYTQLAQ